MEIVKQLRELPEGCTFALYNPIRKKSQLFICKNGLIRIPRIINDLRTNEHTNKELCRDLEDLELIILETSNDYSLLRLHVQYWYDYMKDIGLETYSKHTYLKYKARVNVGYDFNGEQKVFVELVNRRNESFIVGVFDNMYDAKTFKVDYFDSMKYVYPVYANNESTKKYSERTNSELSSVFKVRF